MIPDESVSLVFTSSPYNVGIKYGNHDDVMPYHKYIEWLGEVWKDCYRVLRIGGRLVINIDCMINKEEDRVAESIEDTRREYRRPIYADLCNINKEIGFNFRYDIAWDKHQVVGRGTDWGSWKSCSNPAIRRRHEYILIWSKGPWRLEPTVSGTKSDLTGEEFTQWSMSYWSIPPETQKRGSHEAPFPERLALPVIKMFSYPKDVVLDPFCGTGTTCVVAHKLGRRYIGIDNDEKSVVYARNRIDTDGADLFADMET